MLDRKARKLLFASVLIIFVIQAIHFVDAQSKADSKIYCSPQPEETSPKFLGKAWTKLTISIDPPPKGEVKVIISLYDTSERFVDKTVVKIPAGGKDTIDYAAGLQDGAWKVVVTWNGDSELNGSDGSCHILVKLNLLQKGLSWGTGWLNVFNITSVSTTAVGIAYILQTLHHGGVTAQVKTRYLKTGITSGLIVSYWLIYGAYLSQI